MSPAGSYHPSPFSSPRERLRNVDDLDDDKQSTLSHSSGTPRANQGKDALRLVAGSRVRHGRCAPEFLEEIATTGVPDSLRKATSKKFKFLLGSDARTYFKNYIIQYFKKESSRQLNETITNQEMPAPIVFAVTVLDASGAKCVDYYMTWRGYSKINQSREVEHKVNRFDKDFKRLALVLDAESRHLSSLRTYDSLSRTNRKSEKNSPTNPPSRKSYLPPGITVSTPDEPEGKSDVKIDPSLPEPPRSATDSVVSLPLLNMVRNVPFSHRLPLRVTNPDRLSMVSEISIVPGKLPEELSSEPINHSSKEANNTLTVPVHSKSSKHGSTEEPIKKSSDSICSSDTKSSKSSRSSRSSARSEGRSSRNTSPGDGENAGHSSRRRKDSSKDEAPEFLIVLLGDLLDIDMHSWHGLERQTSIRSVPAERHSPWIGPLASEEKENPLPHHYAYSNAQDDSDSESSQHEHGHWKNIPVIPMKPLMEAMGLIPSVAHFSPPVVPGGLPYHHALSNAGSPLANSSPYIYSSPRLDSSPYIPSWIPQLPVPSNATSVPSRPPSRAYSSAYASPYMQSHTGPF
ncbi:hypothetical protein BDN70DRAFT_869975 [Pholiota conissans]|uniref:Uncharacterized protein n=1 Tax=Pholiota conissans TaxID=109636 RepID=A0A9P5ZHC1_9AGAR|nr:hypothetical protein BDN70DRAFT_869975 [Pholiota conissans]